MYLYAGHAFPGALVNGIQKRLDLLVAGPLLGPTQLAFYSVGAQGFQALMSLPRALTGLLTRSLCKADRSNAYLLASSATKKVLLYMSLPALAATALGPWLLPLVYGASFSAAVPAFVILVWASVFSGGQTCLQTLCYGLGKPGLASMSQILISIVKILLLMWLVVPYGITGCALATVFSAIFGFTLQVWQTKSLSKQFTLIPEIICDVKKDA
jgi:O-antigen/teichoic acid export membrane protein